MVMKIHRGSFVLAYFPDICEYWWSEKDAERICCHMLSWQPISYHSNQKMLLRKRDFIVFLANKEYCHSRNATTPLTRATREGHCPSMK